MKPGLPHKLKRIAVKHEIACLTGFVIAVLAAGTTATVTQAGESDAEKREAVLSELQAKPPKPLVGEVKISKPVVITSTRRGTSLITSEMVENSKPEIKKLETGQAQSVVVTHTSLPSNEGKLDGGMIVDNNPTVTAPVVVLIPQVLGPGVVACDKLANPQGTALTALARNAASGDVAGEPVAMENKKADSLEAESAVRVSTHAFPVATGREQAASTNNLRIKPLSVNETKYTRKVSEIATDLRVHQQEAPVVMQGGVGTVAAGSVETKPAKPLVESVDIKAQKPREINTHEQQDIGSAPSSTHFVPKGLININDTAVGSLPKVSSTTVVGLNPLAPSALPQQGIKVDLSSIVSGTFVVGEKPKAEVVRSVVATGIMPRSVNHLDLSLTSGAADSRKLTVNNMAMVKQMVDMPVDKLTVNKGGDILLALQTEPTKQKFSASASITQRLQMPIGSLFKRKEAVNLLYSDQLKEIVAFEVQHGNVAAAKERCALAIKSFSGDQVARDAGRLLLLTLFEEGGRSSIAKAGEQTLVYIEKGTPDYEYATLDAGLFAFQRDDADLAKQLFEGFIKQYPDSAWSGDAKTGLGLCVVAEGDLSLALGLFNDVWKSHPESSQAPKAMFMAGWVYMAKDRLDWAKETYAKLIKKYPSTEYAKRASLVLQQHGMKPGKDY